MFGNLDVKKSEAMRHIACRDAEEADRVLSREEMERREEAKDNYNIWARLEDSLVSIIKGSMTEGKGQKIQGFFT